MDIKIFSMGLKKREVFCFEFLATFLILTLVYRILFFINLYNIHVYKVYNLVVYLTVGFRNDLLVACGGLLLFSMLRKIKRNYFLLSIEIITLIIITLIYTVHRKIFSLLLIGFNYNIFQDCIQFYKNYNLYSSFISWIDCALLLTPIAIYLLLLRYAHKIQLILFSVSAIILGLYINNGLFRVLELEDQRSQAVYRNPIFYFIRDVWINHHSKYSRNINLPSKKQLNSIALIDPLFNYSFNHLPLLTLNKDKAPTNILILILESVGLEYIFKELPNHEIPMPFLKKIANNGVFFTNNYATGNASQYSAFSLITGLYANTKTNHFEMRNKLNVPCLVSWLKPSYDSRFYTAQDINFFFPTSLFKRSFKKIYDQASFPQNDYPEITGFNFFMQQLKNFKHPFFVAYWSNAAHYPYEIYPIKHPIPNTENRTLNRYLQNLRLLDEEIETLFYQLQKTKLLQNTIIIIVGDHGEGFGQHPGSKMHGTKIFEEQIKVPLIIYAPQFLKTKQISEVTSTADILPSILDSLRIPYNPASFQGTSFFQLSKARRYVFVYGDENELAAIDMYKNKMIIDFSHGLCSKYNLSQDPAELHPLSCRNRQQEEAILAFRNYQTNLLVNLDNRK